MPIPDADNVAALIGTSADISFILVVAILLDPLAAVLLLAATHSEKE